MVCVKICMISVIMASVFLSLMTINPSTNIYKKLIELLDENQKKILDKITEERKFIFYVSLSIGLCLSILLIYGLSSLKYTPKTQVCVFIISLIIIISLVYTVYPKSDQFVRHLSTEEQRNAWGSLKKDIKLKKMVGGLIGLFIYSIMHTL